jgi:hypothetical protein
MNTPPFMLGHGSTTELKKGSYGSSMHHRDRANVDGLNLPSLLYKSTQILAIQSPKADLIYKVEGLAYTPQPLRTKRPPRLSLTQHFHSQCRRLS